MTAPHEIYSRLLFQAGEGYPLWNPSLPADCPKEYELTGIQVGDVGYLASDGGFVFLFNISLDKDHAINKWRGVGPDDFVPVDLGPNKVHHDRYPEYYGTKSLICYTERGEKSIEGDMSASIPHSPVTVGSIGRQQSSYSEAAALILLNGGSKDDYRRDLSGWAAQNVIRFYHYVITEMRYDVPNGGLYLVTGVTNTDSWHISTFSQKSGGNYGSFEVGVKGALSGSFSMSTASSVTGSHTPRYSPSNHKGQNQSVFIRGWKMMIKTDIFGRLKGPQMTKIAEATFSALRKVECSPFSPGSIRETPMSDRNIASSTSRRGEPHGAGTGEAEQSGERGSGNIHDPNVPSSTTKREQSHRAETREGTTADNLKDKKPQKHRRSPSDGPRGPPGPPGRKRDGPGGGAGGTGKSGGAGSGSSNARGRGGQADDRKGDEGNFHGGGGKSGYGRRHTDESFLDDLDESAIGNASDSAESMHPRLHPYHPSDVINKYLLEMCPESEVALTHDAIWSSIPYKSLLDDEELLQRINANYKIHESETTKTCIFVSQDREIHPQTPKLVSIAGQYKDPSLNNACQSLFGKNFASKIRYEYESRGHQHNIIWRAIVYLDGVEYGKGEGRTQRDAGSAAAAQALSQLGNQYST